MEVSPRAKIMKNYFEELEKQVRATRAEVGEVERVVFLKAAKRLHIARDTNREFDEQLSIGDRIADKVASFGGSWAFIILFFSALFGWILINVELLAHMGLKQFDPYPFILLNLVLSMLASIQAPVIMMSQNRQAEKDRLNATHDYEVNLKAELEILALHSKLDNLRNVQWNELVALQKQQLELLERLCAVPGVYTEGEARAGRSHREAASPGEESPDTTGQDGR